MRPTSQIAIIASIVAIAVRLIALDQPFTDTWSWRQSDVAAIARNYFQGGFHFASPQIDWAGDQPGYVGTEFPILPFFAALCYKVLGIHEWIGRVQGVIFFAISLPFFFLLVREILGEIAATWALIFYSFAPLNIMAGRCFMPDVPSLVLSLIGLYFFMRWIDQNRSTAFFTAAIAISLSILIKLPSAIIGAPLATMAFQRFRFSAFRDFKLWLFAAITLVPAAIWYWHAYQISVAYYPHHFFGAGGIKIMPFGWYWQIAIEIPSLILTPVVFVLTIVGLYLARSKSEARPFYWWLVAMILSVIVIGYGNRHPWYRLPLVPIAAVFAGFMCAFAATKISSTAVKITASICLMAASCMSSIVAARVFYAPKAVPFRDAGLALKNITPEDSLIAVADNGDPTVLYYGERKGWHFLEKDGIYYGDPDGSAPAIANLDELRNKGAKYLVFTSNTAWWLDLYPEFREYVHQNSALVVATPEFSIYRLEPMTK